MHWSGWLGKDRYQIIFIDGAKAQYQSFLPNIEALEERIDYNHNIGFHNCWQ